MPRFLLGQDDEAMYHPICKVEGLFTLVEDLKVRNLGAFTGTAAERDTCPPLLRRERKLCSVMYVNKFLKKEEGS